MLSGWVSARVFLRSLWDPYENGFADVERKFLENATVALSTAQVHAMLYKKIVDKGVLENKELKALRERGKSLFLWFWCRRPYIVN